MPLSTQRKAEYAELINQELDDIPATCLEDFDAVIACLKSVLVSNSEYPVSHELEEFKNSLLAYLDDPSIYIRQETDYEEFRHLIRSRIQSKITEFERMSDTDKHRYVKEQREHRERVLKQQAEMSCHEPPAPHSECHVVSNTEWLRRQRIRGLVEESRFTYEQLQQPGANKLSVLIQNSATVCFLIDNGVLFADLVALDVDKLTVLLENPSAIISFYMFIIHAFPDVSFAEITRLDLNRLKVLLKYPTTISLFMNNSVSFAEITETDLEKLNVLLKNSSSIINFIFNGVPFTALKALDLDKIKILIQYLGFNIPFLKRHNIQFDELFALETRALQEVLTDRSSERVQAMLRQRQSPPESTADQHQPRSFRR